MVVEAESLVGPRSDDSDSQIACMLNLLLNCSCCTESQPISTGDVEQSAPFGASFGSLLCQLV